MSPFDCPLCEEWGHSLRELNSGLVEVSVSPEQFEKHLGKHLLALALFALPKWVDEDDTSEYLSAEEITEEEESQQGDDGRTAWFLKHNLEDDLRYDVKGLVKGGTLDALIERLTRHDMMDSTFNSTFLLTFPSFTTAEELFARLKGRYYLFSTSELIVALTVNPLLV